MCDVMCVSIARQKEYNHYMKTEFTESFLYILIALCNIEAVNCPFECIQGPFCYGQLAYMASGAGHTGRGFTGRLQIGKGSAL